MKPLDADEQAAKDFLLRERLTDVQKQILCKALDGDISRPPVDQLPDLVLVGGEAIPPGADKDKALARAGVEALESLMENEPPLVDPARLVLTVDGRRIAEQVRDLD